MVKHRKIVISSLAVAASLITYLAWRKRINKRKKQVAKPVDIKF